MVVGLGPEAGWDECNSPLRAMGNREYWLKVFNRDDDSWYEEIEDFFNHINTIYYSIFCKRSINCTFTRG